LAQAEGLTDLAVQRVFLPLRLSQRLLYCRRFGLSLHLAGFQVLPSNLYTFPEFEQFRIAPQTNLVCAISCFLLA
jgi:hypothetical protein